MHSHKSERWIIIILALINFVNILDFMIMMPLGPQIKRVFILGPSQWSTVVASYTFAAFISGILSIFVIDKFDRKRLLLIVLIGFIVGTFLCGIANSYNTMILARAVAGFFGGVLSSLVLAIVGDVIPFERRSSAMGAVMAGFSAAAALGVPFGLYFGTKFGWQLPFYVAAIFSVFILILAYYKIPFINSHLLLNKNSKPLLVVKEILLSRNKLTGFIFMALIILGQFLIIPFLSPYMVANVGFKEEQLTLIYLIGGLFTVFSGPIIGKLSDRYSNQKVFMILMLISLIPIVVITHLGNTSIPVVLIFTSMFFVFAGGRMIPAMSLVMATAEPRLRGVFMSIRSAIQQIASGLAATISGKIIIEASNKHYMHYNWVGFLAIACSLGSGYLLYRFKADN
jgi:predicted MFS family arabinose efflux permease